MTTRMADSRGHTEVLEWARENGCPEDTSNSQTDCSLM